MRDEVLSRLAMRLPHTDLDSVIESLQRSPQLQGDLQWLDEILDAADLLALPPVPADVSARLHALWPEPRSPRLETATLIHDSRTAGELIGVRGIHRSTGWTALFTAASGDIAIDGKPHALGKTVISGQILGRSPVGTVYEVSMRGPTEVRTTSDEVGQFLLGTLADGQYTFEAVAPDHTLTATIDVAS